MGELWEVDPVTLLGLDEYEGCGKGYYQRRRLNVQKVQFIGPQVRSFALLQVSLTSRWSAICVAQVSHTEQPPPSLRPRGARSGRVDCPGDQHGGDDDCEEHERSGGQRVGGETVEAQAYFKTESSAELRAEPFIGEYTREWHSRNYKAIRHISVKQVGCFVSTVLPCAELCSVAVCSLTFVLVRACVVCRKCT